MSICQQKFSFICNEDIGKLVLRLALSFMLFHGVHKVLTGIQGIKYLVTKTGLPEALAYGVYWGEVLVPLLILVGFFTRISAFFLSCTMGFAIYLAHSENILALGKTGGPLIELPALYLLMGIALLFLGAGKYSFDARCK